MASNIAPLCATLLFSHIANMQCVICLAKADTDSAALPWGKTHSAKLLHRVLSILHSAFCADGGWFWGVGLLVCQLLILHLVRFIKYRRAVVTVAESRGQDGRYILDGTVARREEAAARIINIERECGERE